MQTNANIFQDYKYVENNPMSEISDPLQKGKELLVKGDIPGAVLCFEAAVQQDETCVEAWKLLGTTWAENEQVQDNILIKIFEIKFGTNVLGS